MWDKNWNDNNCNNGVQEPISKLLYLIFYFYYNYSIKYILTGKKFVCQAYLEASHPLPTGDEKWPSKGNCKEGWVKYARNRLKSTQF